MKNLFSKELANASEMYQVQNGVQRVLRDKLPVPFYLVGPIDIVLLPVIQTLNSRTARIRQHLLPQRLDIFSDDEVFDPMLVQRLQRAKELTEEQFWEYRMDIVTQANIAGVLFYPEIEADKRMVELYRAAQSSGRDPLILQGKNGLVHPWLLL